MGEGGRVGGCVFKNTEILKLILTCGSEIFRYGRTSGDTAFKQGRIISEKVFELGRASSKKQSLSWARPAVMRALC